MDENKICGLNPDKSHNIFIKIRNYYFDKLLSEFENEKINIIKENKIFEYFEKNIKFFSTYGNYIDFLSYYFKNKWGIK